MTTSELLSHLNDLNVRLRADNGQLVVAGPKGVLTLALRAELLEHKAEILTFLGNGASTALQKEPPLQRVPRNGKLPLSFAQQRLWFLDQYEPDRPFYNIPFGVRLSGPLNVAALDQSVSEIIRRHEALRTTFSWLDGEPVQIIAPPVDRSLSVVDLSDHSVSEREDEARRLASEEARRPFDLGLGPLFRTTLIRLGENEHVLLLTLHHIVSDGWSMGVLFGELSVLYEAFCCSQPSPLPELPIQYADYAMWQRDWLRGEVLDRQLSYWKRRLEGVPPLLSLPTDRPRPASQSYRGELRSFVLSKDLSEQLKDLSRKEAVTLYMTLLAGFQMLLYRYTGQEDIVVGSPIANRNRTETEGLIGFLVNMLVLRTDLSGNPTFRELLQRVRKTALEAYEYQDLPFEKLVEELKPERSLSHSPLFQVVFILHNAPADSREISGLVVNLVKLENDMAKFDLTLSMIERSDGLKGSWEYNTDLFDEETIVRIDRHFRGLLEGIAVNPEQSVSDLDILAEPEKHELLIEWNDTKRDYPADATFPELFEAQAERTPDVVAIVFEERQLTYRELNARANQLAHYLRKRGVGPEVLVGVYLERSIEMVVALLGTLKAGGAYVPLDPTYPSERLSFMVEDAGLTVLVTQPELVGKLPAHQAWLIALATDWSQFSGESEENPTPDTNSINLAYVIYTSGSTGKPKGVQIPRGALSNFLHSMGERPGMTSQDTLLAVTTLSFDIAGLELHLPLSVGGRVVLMRRESAADGGRLAEKIKSSGATVMQATPATWRLLLESGWEGNKQLKILCGGEALPRALADQLIERSASLWNMYGPTETTIWSTIHQVSSTEGPVLVGRPIANTRIYILDRYMQPTPIGVLGELCIGGAGVARGYLNRPELTEEKFIADPFSEEPGARLYRTGDLARYLADGNIELLGRIDHQVKVRGFRIELGEIEAVLREHPALRDAVVLAREDVPGEKRLVGYVVAADLPPTTGELRSFLQNKLPDYMVPGVFVYLQALPLTPNGKVDRRALPVPDTARPELDSVFVAPESGIEKTLAEIWCGVLGVERVGIHDNFFDLGGHSLLLAKVHSQVRAALGREVAMIDLFRYSTISALAKYLSNGPEEDSLKESADRAQQRRSAMRQQQLRMQSVAVRQGGLQRRSSP